MTIQVRENGKVRAIFRKKGISTSKTFNSKIEAKLWLEELDKLLLLDPKFLEVDVLLEVVIDRYLKEFTYKKASYKSERLRLLSLARSPIAKKPIHQITVQDLQEWQNQRLQQVSVGTVLREGGTFSSVLSQAVRWELIPDNPYRKVLKPKEPKPRSRRYEAHEIELIIKASDYSLDLPIVLTKQRVGAVFLFAIETAMRAGEICGLTWDSVNFEKRIAFLPKTKNGHARTVPLSSKAIDILEHFARQVQDERLEGPVFGINQVQLDSNFRKIKRLVGLHNADLHFHDTRREALSRLSKKFNVMELAKISGHLDLRILQNTYYAPDISEFAQRLI